MMIRILFGCLFLPGFVLAQVGVAPCDSAVIRLYARASFDLNSLPCERFVVIGAEYYDRIAAGYNLSRGMVTGQQEVLHNLQAQLNLANQYAATLKTANDSAQATVMRFRENIRGYEMLLQQSTAENRRVVAKTNVLLNDLKARHKREVRGARWKGILVGGILGSVLGAVLVLLVN
jgi:hypothetical protein